MVPQSPYLVEPHTHNYPLLSIAPLLVALHDIFLNILNNYII